MTREEFFMNEAIQLSLESIHLKGGGPFGCVVVKGNEIVGRGNNKVTSANDPTAHAEIVAIRDACSKLKTYQLCDCEVYTSCEPCPMCMGAIYWAHPNRVYFANTRADAAEAGFNDAMIYNELTCDHAVRKIPVITIGRVEALKVLEAWKSKEDKITY